MGIHFDTEEDFATWLKTPAEEPAHIAGVSKRKKPEHRERRQQTYFFNWVFYHENTYPALRWLFHAPNGSPHGSGMAGGIMKKMGTRRGILDVLCLEPHHGFAGAAVDFKDDDDDALDYDQVLFGAYVEHLGWCVRTFTNWIDAVRFFVWYAELPEHLLEGLG